MNIDAVAMMRRIRDDLDRQMQGMTWEEKRAFIRDSIKSFDFITKKKNDDYLGNSGREIPRAGETCQEKRVGWGERHRRQLNWF
uniref:Uncharacterized protein n=1 Tax=Candidatus Kentrum sp. FM TaxID=2126340 RepID=A0A450U2W5_9GAMM|nr:MAG: hypothetical protein BECKFM1743C_GA0114222_108372 [Candidatus Kentron sp. FM]VFJ77485.1 MAG: hypothetical protein BECKFM1743A_GA0114220_109921 [Candidatus Kentron sp. FM]VFK18633.1 MAG: hypothetical protein BECKFM1743B_GA0114221_105625 [Candidatus Kentron sp. FM]